MLKKRKYANRVQYTLDGLRHREDGPAVDTIRGIKEWYKDGNLHRLDGPAIVCGDGTNFWYINGVELTSEITQWFEDTSFNPNYTTWTIEEQMQFKLVWC